MPTYVYECTACKEVEEVVCPMAAMEEMKPAGCKVCGEKVARIITNTNKHTDNTPWRKGHYNGKEDWR